MNIYVYKITVNSKSYVGVSKDPDDRLKHHFINSSYIGNALRKYGLSDFDIIDQVETYEEAFALEIYYIEKLNTMSPNGYNLTVGGEGSLGHTQVAPNKGKPCSEQQKNKISNKLKGRNISIMSEDGRKRVSASKKGMPRSDETKKKISDTLKGNIPWNKGIKQKNYKN